MRTAVDKVSDEVLALPTDVRIMLVDRILASLNLPTQPDIDRMWAEEAERRAGELDRNQAPLVPGEEVFDRICRKHGR